MPQEMKLIVKGLKPYKDNHTGEDMEPISGLPIFPDKTQWNDVAHFHNKKSYLYTEAEHLATQSEAKSPETVKNEINEKLDSVMALMIEVAKLNVEDK